MKKFGLVVIWGLFLLNSGCATSRTEGWKNTGEQAQLSPSQQSQLRAEAMKLWENRHVRSDLEGALTKFEKLASSNSQDLESRIFLSRGNYLLADSHIETMDEKKKGWEIGTSWGEKALAIHPDFYKKVVEEKKSPEEALQTLDKTYIAALYWTAVNLGKWAKNSGIATTLKYKTRIRTFIEKVESLDPKFFYGAAFRYWGVYYAVAPSFAGGSIEKSWDNFQKSLKMANQYLATHVLISEIYAPRKDDRELFKKHLEFVIQANPKELPDIIPENILEQKKAKKMLAEMDRFF